VHLDRLRAHAEPAEVEEALLVGDGAARLRRLRGADRKNRGTFRGTTPRRVQESPAVPACEDAGDKPPGRR
jgi:hypothetical protein